MLKGIYRYTNPHLREFIAQKKREFWWYFSLIIIPLGMTLICPISTFIARMDGVSAAAGISFLKDMQDHHFVSFLFGISFLIFFDVGFFGVEIHDIKQWHSVCTAGRKRQYLPEEVDEQANAPESEWLPALGIILAPEIIIGFDNGFHVVRYEDIERLKTEEGSKNVHLSLFKWKYMDSITLRPSGSINELTLAVTVEDPELVRMELDIIRERCQQHHPGKTIKIVNQRLPKMQNRGDKKR